MKKRIYTLMFAAASVLAVSSCGDDDVVSVSEVKLSSATVALFTGETASLTVEVLPLDVENKNITWSSSNETIVTIDAEGKLTAVAPGVATITATAQDNGVTGSAEVTVKNGYVFDSQRKEIIEGVYADYTEGETGNGFQFWFYANAEEDGVFDEANEYIYIDIPNEMMGQTFELTEEQLYDWGWWIAYDDKDSEVYYEGFGDIGQMEDVASGTMRADIIAANKFRVKFDVTYTDGKKLKGEFFGELPEDKSYYGGRTGGRKAAEKRGNF
jgi:hypothetical protein